MTSWQCLPASLLKNSCKPQLTVHCTMAWAKKTDMDGLQWNQETTKDYHVFHVVFCLNTKGYNLVRCVLTFIYLYVIYIYLNHCSPIHACLFLELFQAHHALPLIEGFSKPMTLLGFSKPIWHWAFPSPCGIRLFQAHLPGAASLFQDQGPSSLFQDYWTLAPTRKASTAFQKVGKAPLAAFFCETW